MGDGINLEDIAVPSGPRCASISGVSVHANVCVQAHERMRLERLCHYAGRAPVAIERLSFLPDGRLLYRLKGQLSEPPERFWVASVEVFERSDCHNLPNALKYIRS